MTRRLALITGASAGIGAAIAKEYAAKGCDLALTARRADRLDALALEIQDAHDGVKVDTFVSDLSRASASGDLLDKVEDACGDVDILVNNAGYGIAKRFLRD